MQTYRFTRNIVCCLAVFMAAILWTSNNSLAFSLFSDGYESVTPKDGAVIIPVDKVDDGDIHFYKLADNGKDIRFFLLQSNDGVVRAAFDACDVCYESRKGYSLEGDFVRCNNCGMRFHSSRINVAEGGCNPAPLKRTRDDGSVRIQTADILSGARFF
ncbi:DUF2318 domain-containing protein [Pseudodesulfovibrio thermohalotolerans]|uniref:DUF2318 domain-containing protein n=1 Tax=Pseudodesulfovibrio thermohalotolerans TaxID=2880651 RepID=UPI002442D9E1|nr:DUF2318 domain-containing protein [Pseudodesulfovibrio thermohalotolerans]WFS62745.1 DUF2318 domain-containing protein [Pseudodesulfovibrio thermohalotolerans]